MEDAVAVCKEKLRRFRVQDLGDVLRRLKLPIKGRKQDLVDRIEALLSKSADSGPQSDGEEVDSVGREVIVEIINEVFEKSPLLKRGKPAADSKPADGPCTSGSEVRCLCGGSSVLEPMVQCLDPSCKVWQHVACVLPPEESIGGVTAAVSCFHCEICRIQKADPFWHTISHPLIPFRLASPSVAAYGTSIVHNVEKSFRLSRSTMNKLYSEGCELQAWCVLMNDGVKFRVNWPVDVKLEINGMPVPAGNRPNNKQLGANGRADGAIITSYVYEGANTVRLTLNDARQFFFGVRMVERKTLKEVLELVPNEQSGEKLDDALARVQRCIGGNNGMDGDIMAVADCVPVSLRCPVTGMRMRKAGRFKPCTHMGCFDLPSFVELNERSRKWQCPICLKNYSLESIVIDPYFNKIVLALQDCGEDVNDVYVRPDGSWRVKVGGDHRKLTTWHSMIASNGPRGVKRELEPENDQLEDKKRRSFRDEVVIGFAGKMADRERQGLGGRSCNSAVKEMPLQEQAVEVIELSDSDSDDLAQIAVKGSDRHGAGNRNDNGEAAREEHSTPPYRPPCLIQPEGIRCIELDSD